MDGEEQPFTNIHLKHILGMHKHDFCGEQKYLYTRNIGKLKICMHDFFFVGGEPGGAREFVGGGHVQLPPGQLPPSQLPLVNYPPVNYPRPTTPQPTTPWSTTPSQLPPGQYWG